MQYSRDALQREKSYGRMARKQVLRTAAQVVSLFVSVLLDHASRVLIVPEPCEFRMPEMI
jgi:hypothetical protein